MKRTTGCAIWGILPYILCKGYFQDYHTETLIVDWFGNSFRYERTETEPPYGDIGWVRYSPFGMVNWAIQYADRVEVLKPMSLLDEVIERLRRLNQKYGIEG